MTEQTGRTLNFDDAALANELFGPHNATLVALAARSGLSLSSRGSRVTIQGDEAEGARMGEFLLQLYGLLKEGRGLSGHDVAHAYAMFAGDPSFDLKRVLREESIVSPRRTITPKTLNQRAYVAALKDAEMTFGVGPAGTGKTYLAVAVAVSLFLAKRVRRIILTRPAVEAGERLGFLPGDMAQKVDPYLRPLYDALHDMLDTERVAEMLENGAIEVAPLAFMRGRTLSNAFVILDEAQNTTVEQMKMFLTRMGFNSRMAITGDITQIDLPERNGATRSGLVHALGILRNVEGIHIQEFTEQDVVRHPLVARIIHAYDTSQAHS